MIISHLDILFLEEPGLCPFLKNVEFFVFSLLAHRNSFFILNESFVGYNYCKYLLPINGLPFHGNGIYFLRNRIS